MRKLINPPKADWAMLFSRPADDNAAVTESVRSIVQDVQQNGDAALIAYARRFDGATLDTLRVSEAAISDAANKVSSELKAAIRIAQNNITRFHQSQRMAEPVTETMPGVLCWRKSQPIQSVGLYIPGGSAPLFSTVLMLAIPAAIAGCPQIVLCSPPDASGNIHPAILYAAQQANVTEIYKAGGAQAIAAMAYGTESIPRVAKIFGPGNQYVTAAKQLVQQSGTAIDMPAGPSEVLIIADDTCVPAFVAADLLAQAEHGPDSQVVLLSTSPAVADEVLQAIETQLAQLPRQSIAEKALQNSIAVVLDDLSDCIAFSNGYAPEHLIIATTGAATVAGAVVNAGSVFIGNYTCESAGDYASGTNHTLPTSGYARSYSGVSLDSFVKKITFQQISEDGLRNIGPAIETMAEAEQLIAHKNAVTIRLNYLNQ
jgi:histidinol dehydrogenase